jgi:hypothetical protein
MYVLIALFTCFIAHELGHYLVARCFGKKLKYRYGGSGSFIWDMPQDLTADQQQLIAASGFALELLLAIPALIIHPVYGLVYQIVADIHFISYSYRREGTEYNDFKWLTRG